MKKVGVFEEPGDIRFVDLCAGLGGFHRGLSDAAESATSKLRSRINFRCVAASELEDDLRESYVANFPDIAEIYKELHFGTRQIARTNSVDTVDPALLKALPEFDANGQLKKVHGDMTWFLDDTETGLRKSENGNSLLPEHDLLCAGFPCQPFSKSGAQLGFDDTRGTVFHTIATILREKSPAFLLLENVGNFGRHDGGNTWSRVRRILVEDLGYDIVATEHVASGSTSGLLSPHHFGYPHHRERFFIVGQRKKPLRTDSMFIRKLLEKPLSKEEIFPFIRAQTTLSSETGKALDIKAKAGLIEIISSQKSISERGSLISSQIPFDRVRCINHWSELLTKLEEHDGLGHSPLWRNTMPSFPIWGYELDPWNWYPIEDNPARFAANYLSLVEAKKGLLKDAKKRVLELSNSTVNLRDYPPRQSRSWLAKPLSANRTAEWIESWPGYAGKRDVWPRWKQRFIEQNREWAILLWSSLDPQWLRNWLDTLYEVIKVPSYQKLEWNCKGEQLKIWTHILQFRPSGLRVKRLSHVPALVAMTTTQIPIVPRMNADESQLGASPGSLGRHLIPTEALQLQGFPSDWSLPPNRERAFTCFGNAVHVGVVHQIVEHWLFKVR